MKYFNTAKHTLCIDHHVSNQSFAEDNYITVDLKGNLLKVSLEHIMDTEINAYEPNGNDNGMGSVRFNKTNEEIRTIAEKLLGDIVDWSMFDKFDIDLRSPTAPIWDDDHARNKTFAYLYWGDYQGGEPTNREFGCILEFASINDDSTIRTFYDKAYIRYISIVNPFGKIDDLSKYIERIPKYEEFNEYYVNWLKEESGNEPYDFDRDDYRNGRLTVYNGKISYYIFAYIHTPNVEDSAKSIYLIIPLE